MKLQTVKIRYDATFEKEVTLPRGDNEEDSEFMNRVENEMDKYRNDYLDGDFIEFSEPEVLSRRLS